VEKLHQTTRYLIPIFAGKMKRTAFTTIAAALCLLYSCSQPPHDTEAKRRADSLAIQTKAAELAKQMLQHQKDSLAHADSLANLHAARRNYGPCPVAIKKCSLSTDHNGKSVIVTLRNASAKKIETVHIAWTVYNKAGKAIGGSNGKAKKMLAQGQSSSYSWGINAPNGTTAKASVAGIRYSDGSVWMAD